MSKKPRKKRSVEPTDYGFVRVIAGRHAGGVGWYDDDGPGGAIVYLSTRSLTEPIVVRHTSLVAASAADGAIWEAVHENDVRIARVRKSLRERGRAR